MADTTQIIRRLAFNKDSKFFSDEIDKEWLITNGLGGYASLSILGGPLRKYHGLLIAALPPPLGRIVMFNYVEDAIRVGETALHLSYLEFYETTKDPQLTIPLIEFRLENGLPVWKYENEEITLEKKIFFPYMENTMYISYELLKGPKEIELTFRPFFQFRHHETSPKLGDTDQINCINHNNEYCEIFESRFPHLYLRSSNNNLIMEEKKYDNVRYRYEEERGYDSKGSLISPCYFKTTISHCQPIYFVASAATFQSTFEKAYNEEKERRKLLIQKAKKINPSIDLSSFSLELLFAGDQFIIKPLRNFLDKELIQNNERTIIAGYHWFTDWGRDLMISLEGLMLITGRLEEAANALIAYSHHIKDGLIPNMFPDGKNEGRYNTADASLWFFHAIDRYLNYKNDNDFLEKLMPKLREIIKFHIEGTKFGIHVDLSDGLLVQGQEGFALTWMDAVVDNLVVTPRRGKAVEINALWYNALCLMVEWMERFGEHEKEILFLKRQADQCYETFNKKFWNEEKGYLFDVVEGENGNDAACRPNQLFSISLKYPILKREYWASVFNIVNKKLLTPFGLRTLSPDHPDFKVRYQGNLFLRDCAYHQGTVWPWLIGPFIDAWLKVYPNKKEEAVDLLEKFTPYLSSGGIGTISEIFDADAPYTHRGCIAQAWSVAEILRCNTKLTS